MLPRWFRSRASLALLLPLALAPCRPAGPAGAAEREAYLRARGALVSADTVRIGMHGRYAMFRVELRSSTGMVATGRLLQPPGEGGRHPGVLLNDGRELDSRAVEALPREFGDVVVLSLDFPPEIPYALDMRGLLGRIGELRDAARRVPSMFSLGGAHLASRSDVAPERVGLVATSFSVPFGAIAAAADSTFRNVAFVYGAGDLAGVIAANMALRPGWLRGPVATVAVSAFAEFEPERFVASIAPRPIVMVNSLDDPQMPVSAVRSLYDAAREPKSITWLATGHLHPSDTALIEVLVDTAFAQLPVLAGSGN